MSSQELTFQDAERLLGEGGIDLEGALEKTTADLQKWFYLDELFEQGDIALKELEAYRREARRGLSFTEDGISNVIEATKGGQSLMPVLDPGLRATDLFCRATQIRDSRGLHFVTSRPIRLDRQGNTIPRIRGPHLVFTPDTVDARSVTLTEDLEAYRTGKVEFLSPVGNILRIRQKVEMLLGKRVVDFVGLGHKFSEREATDSLLRRVGSETYHPDMLIQERGASSMVASGLGYKYYPYIAGSDRPDSRLYLNDTASNLQQNGSSGSRIAYR